MIKRSVCLLLVSIALINRGLCQRSPAKGFDRVVIGILDDSREETANWKPGVADTRLIRIGFERTATGWRKASASSIAKRMTWTIAFNGRTIGAVKSEDPSLFSGQKAARSRYYSFVQLLVTPFNEIPSVGVPSVQFAPMATPIGPTKGRRPLVALSKPNSADPDGWERSMSLPEAIQSIVRADFRREFPHIVRCKNEEITIRNWKFPDSALSFPVVYASNKGTFLVEASLNAGDCGYVDDPNDPLSEPWFFVSSDGRAKHFGSFLYLLDAGDYDNDGRSELIFMLNQPEDTDGFVLYDADLKEQARLVWTYH